MLTHKKSTLISKNKQYFLKEEKQLQHKVFFIANIINNINLIYYFAITSISIFGYIIVFRDKNPRSIFFSGL